ncbi:helix-turn-helix domain-containing protein [Rossellomorea sp. KS-H15a]|uniref:helix-turn-helix domain-containing protein n=1 Tax=Rossellomorea sp. KS-H15a TaxID=2963940 RepID=UPI0020C6D905|nr:helix-turn-helix domain-containing protein [Rossellomorea sp. KS-H15a]UTE76680.1 helix-turn-helix domain-containing protein [Rossellomorea sp. KS-H15a]
MKQRSTNISLIILALCILAGAWMISNAIQNSDSQNVDDQVTVNMNSTEGPQLLSSTELKDYLGISDEQLELIYPRKEDDVVISEIPYIKMGYEYYFPVKAIDRWLEETEGKSFQ